eukprot:5785062-Pyramimonas_sp.AAC.1
MVSVCSARSGIPRWNAPGAGRPRAREGATLALPGTAAPTGTPERISPCDVLACMLAPHIHNQQ